MKRLCLSALLVLAFAACERKPTEEEIATVRKAEEASRPAPASPSPKPGDWMWKDRKKPFDDKPRK